MAHFSGITRGLTIILLLAFYLNTSHGLKQRRQTPKEDETFRLCGNENFPGICFTEEKAEKYNCLSLEEDSSCPDETLCCKLSEGKSFQEEKRNAGEKLFAESSLTEETDLDLEEEKDENVEKRVRREDEEEKGLHKIGKRSGNINAGRSNKKDNSGDGKEGPMDNGRNGEKVKSKNLTQNVRGNKQEGNRNNKLGNSPDTKSGGKVVRAKSLSNGGKVPESQDGRKQGVSGRVSQSDKRQNTNPGKGKNGSGKGANTNDEETAGEASGKKDKKLKKLSVKQSCKITKICKSRSGTCRTACLSGEKQKGKCKGSQCKCCVKVQTTSCTQTSQCSGVCAAKKKDCSGIYKKGSGCTGSRNCGCCISCTATTTCTNAKGKCTTKCNTNQREVLNGCTGGASCICCGKKCKPKPTCSAQGGTCVEKETDCAGTFQANGCKFGCHCCVPTPTTTTKTATTTKPLPTASSSTT